MVCDPDWHGTGVINKLIMHFPHNFWTPKLSAFARKCDMFGVCKERAEDRGTNYMFWDFSRCLGKPVLATLFVGNSARKVSEEMKYDLLQGVMSDLRKVS